MNETPKVNSSRLADEGKKNQVSPDRQLWQLRTENIRQSVKITEVEGENIKWKQKFIELEKKYVKDVESLKLSMKNIVVII